jgi:creatinine amidohydrolase/Fe(II)-dependent formamide hydrolase-like protein
MGCDTIIVERLADDLSAEFHVVRAPTVEYGVALAPTPDQMGSASVRRKTLHRFMNDLVGAWEETGVEQFIILTANGHEAHQEALTTLHTRSATVQTVDIFGVPLGTEEDDRKLPIHGGQIDTSLLLISSLHGAKSDATAGEPHALSVPRRPARWVAPRWPPLSKGPNSTSLFTHGLRHMFLAVVPRHPRPVEHSRWLVITDRSPC